MSARKRVRFDDTVHVQDSHTILILNTTTFTISTSVQNSWKRCQTFVINDSLIKDSAAERVMTDCKGYILVDASMGRSRLKCGIETDIYDFLSKYIWSRDSDSEIETDARSKHTTEDVQLLHDDEDGVFTGLNKSVYARVLIVTVYRSI